MTSAVFEKARWRTMPDAEEDQDWLLGLAFNVALRAGVSEADLERVLGVPPGAFAAVEAGTHRFDESEARILRHFHDNPKQVRRAAALMPSITGLSLVTMGLLAFCAFGLAAKEAA